MSFRSSPRFLALLGAILALAGSCAAAPSGTSPGDFAQETAAPQAAPEVTADAAGRAQEAEPVPPGAPAPASRPQLIKTARLTLHTPEVETTVEAIRRTVTQAGGDLISLQDDRSPAGAAHRMALTLRVPQAEFDAVVNTLGTLATVQQQAISAEDVSEQLVDLEARVRNLRQSEAALLQIMERSGAIAEVLEVSRELSTVRDTIERLDAQQQQLQRRVAFSTITVTVENPVASTALPRPVAESLGQTWQRATGSVQQLTVGLLKLGLWLLAYSPYWGLIALLVFGGRRLGAVRAARNRSES